MTRYFQFSALVLILALAALELVPGLQVTILSDPLLARRLLAGGAVLLLAAALLWRPKPRPESMLDAQELRHFASIAAQADLARMLDAATSMVVWLQGGRT